MSHWMVGAALLLILSLIFDLALLAYAMYALLSALLISRYLTRIWSETLTATRECNRLTADVGDTVAVIVDIENKGWLPIPWCLIEDLLPRHALIHHPPNLGVEGRRVQLSTLAAGGKRSLRYQLRCNRRGYYQLGPLVLETGDLFGLHRRYRVATKPHFLLVYPKVVPLVGYDIQTRRPIGEVKMTYRLYEDPTRIAGVRQYESGDPLNRVHWRATARTGQLHSKVYEPSTVAGATIMLEFHQSSHASQHEPFRSELAITAAASLANAVYEMGQQIGLVTNGRDAADRIRQEGWDVDLRSREAARNAGSMLAASDRLRPVQIETRRGADQLTRILEMLARLELTDGLTLPQLCHETAGRIPRHAAIVVILPVMTRQSAVALGNLRRQGYAVAVVLNLWDEYDFAQAAGLLSVEGGMQTFQLKDESTIDAMCRNVTTGNRL